MSFEKGIVEGFENGSLTGYTQAGYGLPTIQSANPHKNLKNTKGGSYYADFPGYVGINLLEHLQIPMKDIIVEAAFYPDNTNPDMRFAVSSGSSETGIGIYFGISSNLSLVAGYHNNINGHAAGWATLSTSNPFQIPLNVWSWLTCHIIVNDGSIQKIKVYANEKINPTIDYQGAFTTGKNEYNTFNLWGTNCNLDDISIRPRCVIVSGSFTGTPTGAGFITSSSGVSGSVYNYEQYEQGMYRLFLKDLTFGITDFNSGWSNGESVSVPGLTGSVTVWAPNDQFKCGLEPGGMMVGRTYIQKSSPAGVGTFDGPGWDPSTGATRFGVIDEVPVSTTDYLTSTGSNDRYSVTVQSVNAQSVDTLSTCFVATKITSLYQANTGSNLDLIIEMLSGSDLYQSKRYSQQEAYLTKGYNFIKSHFSGSKIVLNDISNLEVGVQSLITGS